ncbi:MAG: hypothetical protein M1823_005980 [Watsoniomyces obsoletus]|nr:MAG: hypothetical protein M1823_005980 [Watsoniomyces obsoletus]
MKTQNDQSKPSEVTSGHGRLSRPAHALPAEQAIAELDVDVQGGLTPEGARARLEEHGRNELDDGPGVRPGKILLRQIANAMVLVLILAMVVSFAIKSWIEGGVVAAVIVLNVVVGFFQEFQAEKTMNSLRSLGSPSASVIRGGQAMVIPTGELVPGDVVQLKTGDTVPADIRLHEAMNLEIDESLLTGESLPAQKDPKEVFDDDTGPGDRLNCAFSSSTVTRGRGTGVVHATGMQTEIGSIAAALRAKQSKRRPVKRKPDGSAKPLRYAQAWTLTSTDAVGRFLGVNVGTPLQRKLSRLAMLLFGIAVVCAIIVLAANRFSNNAEVIIYAVATGLSMIPASLIVVLTITMAVGTKRMVQRNVIVRKLDSLEALGGVTDICSDKTGTLTQGKMLVKKAWIPARGTYAVGETNESFNPTVGRVGYAPSSPVQLNAKGEVGIKDSASASELLEGNEHLEAFLWVASLANLANVYKDAEGTWKTQGDPTEIAIQVFASRFDWNRSRWISGEQPEWSQVAEFPFDSDIKMMSVIFRQQSADGGRTMVFTKGAVERVLAKCSSLVLDAEAGPTALTDQIREQILDNMNSLASEGLRVLAFASKEWSLSGEEKGVEPERVEVEGDLRLLGLIGLYDPPRPESAGAVRQCHGAGIAVHMLTGDHPGTARAIAEQVGILPSRMDLVAADMAAAMVQTASEFDRRSDDEIDRLPVLPLVIARCAPQTKVRMIEALHRRKCYAAMTGDGVNDSPSLKRADVGIAMGQAGSDVAKDASDIVLTDDNFASIVNAIEEGRRMFDNIQKFVLHLLAENIGQACTLLIGLAFKDASRLSVFPLAPVEILWVIMITSGLPDMGLGAEHAAPDIMRRPPQNLKRGVFTFEVMIDMLAYGLWMAALCLAAFVLVVWGFGSGSLGTNCNDGYSDVCDLVFRARATTFVCMTWFALFLAWEMVDMRRSFFRMHPESKRPWTQWMSDVWRNQLLFWAILAGFITIFPTLYIPVINHVVFKHEGISWEWTIVVVESVLFVGGVEAWKWAKRIFFRRRARRLAKHSGHPEGKDDEIEAQVFSRYFAPAP